MGWGGERNRHKGREIKCKKGKRGEGRGREKQVGRNQTYSAQTGARGGAEQTYVGTSTQAALQDVVNLRTHRVRRLVSAGREHPVRKLNSGSTAPTKPLLVALHK